MRSRAYRRHQRARIKARHLRDWRLYHPTPPPPRNLAVRHPFDCGRRCHLCHGAKLLGLPRPGDLGDWCRQE